MIYIDWKTTEPVSFDYDRTDYHLRTKDGNDVVITNGAPYISGYVVFIGGERHVTRTSEATKELLIAHAVGATL